MGPWSQLLYLCIWWHWQNSSPPGAPGHMDPHSRGMNPLPCHTTVQHQHQSEEKCTQKRLLCFFHPSVPKSLAFPCPAPVLETAINCPCIPSLDNYSHLQGSASLQGCISQGEWKRQRRGITSCGHRSAQCGRYPWDSQQTRQEVHPLLSQRHPQCAHQCHETSPEHSHHPQGYKCLKEERELKHTTLSGTLPFPYCTTRSAGLDFQQHNVSLILRIFNMESYSLSPHSWLLVGKERKVSLCAYRY